MKKTLKSAVPVAAEEIAKLADRGKNVSHFFKGEGAQPIQRVNVDITGGIGQGRAGLECEPSGSQDSGPAGSRSALPRVKRQKAASGFLALRLPGRR
jgi:hypothetical protein